MTFQERVRKARRLSRLILAGNEKAREGVDELARLTLEMSRPILVFIDAVDENDNVLAFAEKLGRICEQLETKGGREELTNYQFLKRANSVGDVIRYLCCWNKFIVQFKLEKPLFAALKACEDAETMALFLTESPQITGFPIYEDCLEWLNSPYCEDGYPYEDDGEE